MTKYYAVKKGKKPGIYTSWEECNKQVSGFPWCEYKSFNSKSEAQNYMGQKSIAAQPGVLYAYIGVAKQDDRLGIGIVYEDFSTSYTDTKKAVINDRASLKIAIWAHYFVG